MIGVIYLNKSVGVRDELDRDIPPKEIRGNNRTA